MIFVAFSNLCSCCFTNNFLWMNYSQFIPPFSPIGTSSRIHAMDNQSKVIRCCVSKLFMNKICLHRNDQTETHTTKYNIHTKTILIRFSFRSRWIIFSRIDVWPLILFMCIFYKIPITFKFPIAAAAHLWQYSNIYHVKIYVVFIECALRISKYQLLTIRQFDHFLSSRTFTIHEPTIYLFNFVSFFLCLVWRWNMRYNLCNLQNTAKLIGAWIMHQ